jgi:molecular chaperone DnaK
MARRHGMTVSRSDGAQQGVIRKLKQAAEEAKIELTRQSQTSIVLPNLMDGVDLELDMDRAQLEALCMPLVERSVTVCQRLLDRHHVEGAALQRVVMVGGPTVIPFLRRKVEDALHAPFGQALDPMTLVAQGAALYAAMTNLEACPAQAAPRRACARLWLNFPAMTSDTSPHVVGRVVEEGPGGPVRTMRVVREGGAWQSDAVKLDAEGGFVIQLSLEPHRLNNFTLEARDGRGEKMEIEPASIRLVHGLTITDPPLSRSVGVALADDTVQVYFKRGEPLPARRSFTHRTVETVARGSVDSLLKVPIVQGEFGRAHLCRVIGALDIAGRDIKTSLPAGSNVELTLELDRSGRLSARALVPALNQVFEHVASLLVPDASPETLAAALQNHRQRLRQVRWTGEGIDKMVRIELMLDEAERDLKASQGGDADAGQKAQRNLQEVDALLDELEMVDRWSELDADARAESVNATRWVSTYGSESEKHLLEETLEAVEQARKKRQVHDLERELRQVRHLANAAFNRNPESVRLHFDHMASRADQARDLPKARDLVKQGQTALAKNQLDRVNTIIEQLHALLPPDPRRRRLGHSSGLQ